MDSLFNNGFGRGPCGRGLGRGFRAGRFNYDVGIFSRGRGSGQGSGRGRGRNMGSCAMGGPGHGQGQGQGFGRNRQG